MHAIPKEHRDKLVGLAARKEAFSALGVFRIMSVVHAHQPLRGCYATGIPQRTCGASRKALGRQAKMQMLSSRRDLQMILFVVLLSLPFLTILLIRYSIDPKISHSHERAVIVKQGCFFGLFLGTLFMVLNLFGNVIPLPAALESVIDRVFAPFILGFTIFTFSLSGYRTSRLTGQLRAASLSGLLTGVLVFMLFGLSFIIIDMVFFDIVRQQPEKIANFAHSGYADMRAYLFDSTVRGATVMTLVGGILGAIFGSMGGLVGKRTLAQRQTA